MPAAREGEIVIRSKLLIVEGIPGTGKTSTAVWARDWLAARGIPTRLHLEGNLDHPADYESTACLPAGEYARLLAEFPAWAGQLTSAAQARGREVFVSYRKPSGLPVPLWEALAAREVYELPAEDFQRVSLARWAEFAARAAGEESVYIFECCFLQNQLTTLLARHDLDEEACAAQLGAIASCLRPLAPLLVYLDPPDLPGALAQVAASRPPEWLDFVTHYTTGGAWGRRRGLDSAGFAGLSAFYQARRDMELRLFAPLGLDGLWLPAPAQAAPAALERLEAFLAARFAARDG
jgi:hypothetical protein